VRPVVGLLVHVGSALRAEVQVEVLPLCLMMRPPAAKDQL